MWKPGGYWGYRELSGFRAERLGCKRDKHKHSTILVGVLIAKKLKP